MTVLLTRSDLPRAVVLAVAAAQAATPLAAGAFVVAVVALVVGWVPVAWAGAIVVAAWVGCWGVSASVAWGGGRALPAALVACVAGWAAVAFGADSAVLLPGLPLWALAAGLVAGAVVRWSWDRRQAVRDRRLDALPDWARDELGDAATCLDPECRRAPGEEVVGPWSDPAVRIAAAVCRPLPGATVLAGVPAIAVYGSRVAVVAWGPGLDLAGAPPLPPLPPLPPGATARVFVLREGTELPALLDDAHVVPADPGHDRGAAVDVVASEPQELAAHLAAGAPPDGDALHGIAADMHRRVLDALDGYPGAGER